MNRQPKLLHQPSPFGLFLLVALCVLISARVLLAADDTAKPEETASTPAAINETRPLLRQDLGELIIKETDQGQTVTLQTHDGQVTIPADRLASLIQAEQQRLHNSWGGWFMAFFNISSWWQIPWVALGLGAQVVFTGRMVVQWLVSERSKKSVVPPVFWWMSLIGSTMLLVYFIWRKDAPATLGQSMGWMIYARNLWLIYFTSQTELPPQKVPASTEAT